MQIYKENIMKKKELKKLSQTEIVKNLNNFKKDLFYFRFRKANGQLEDTAKVSTLKRDIAKLYSSLHKKK